MIFVATGTTGFDELVYHMDLLSPTLNEDIVMQIGGGQYIPRQAEYFRYNPTLEPYYEQASAIVAHGGVGITMEVLSRGKPLISVSNPDRYDQHQQDLLKTLSDQNYLIWCRDLEGLAEAIQQAKHMSFKRYVKPTCTIHTQIQTFLSQAIELDDS